MVAAFHTYLYAADDEKVNTHTTAQADRVVSHVSVEADRVVNQVNAHTSTETERVLARLDELHGGNVAGVSTTTYISQLQARAAETRRNIELARERQRAERAQAKAQAQANRECMI